MSVPKKHSRSFILYIVTMKSAAIETMDCDSSKNRHLVKKKWICIYSFVYLHLSTEELKHSTDNRTTIRFKDSIVLFEYDHYLSSQKCAILYFMLHCLIRAGCLLVSLFACLFICIRIHLTLFQSVRECNWKYTYL